MTRIFKPSWFNDRNDNPVGVGHEAKRYSLPVRLSRPITPMPHPQPIRQRPSREDRPSANRPLA